MRKVAWCIIAVILVIQVSQLASADNCSKEDSCKSGVCGVKSDGEPEVKEPAKINTSGLKALLDSKAPVLVFDARSGKWDDGKRIPGAKALSHEAKEEEISKLIPSKDTLVVTYCSNLKCPASHKLYSHLQGLGYKNLLEYPEGIEGWTKFGHSVEEEKKEK
jgi:rhodanese-related sulfurtransferase